MEKKTSAAKSSQKKTKSPKAAAPAGPKEPSQRSLPVVLTGLLAKSKHPLTSRQLAEQALAQGFPTQSKNFTNVVSVTLAHMDNVRNIPGQGYRLTKR